MKRLAAFALAAFTVFLFACADAPKAAAQDPEPTQRITIGYSSAGIVLSGKGDDAVTLRAPVHVEAFPLSPQVKKKHGDDLMISEDVTLGSSNYWMLPLGKYEVHYSIRDGDTTRNAVEVFVLGATGPSALQIDFSRAKTYVIGSSFSLYELENIFINMDKQLNALQAEVTALKGGKPAAAVPAK